MRAASFAPLVDANTRLLIVGSLPGRESLARGQYYAHPRNQFWALLGAVIGADLAGCDYPARLAMLAQHHIGLWDVIGAATRRGSLDSAIRDHRPNDLAALARTLPALRAIGFNGAKAWQLGAGALAATGVALVALPSSSPAYAAMPRATKQQHWARLRAYL